MINKINNVMGKFITLLGKLVVKNYYVWKYSNILFFIPCAIMLVFFENFVKFFNDLTEEVKELLGDVSLKYDNYKKKQKAFSKSK